MLRKLIEESRVRTILLEQFSVSDTGLILDLVCYAIGPRIMPVSITWITLIIIRCSQRT